VGITEKQGAASRKQRNTSLIISGLAVDRVFVCVIFWLEVGRIYTKYNWVVDNCIF
jgi:hypothetical protein